MKSNNLNADSKSFDASTVFFKEDFLHYLWKFKLFDFQDLHAVGGQTIIINNCGTHNQNEGPDFLYAQVVVGEQLWAGNVEIHLKSSDWYVHKHEMDPNYDSVVLHVVWEYDVPVFLKDNSELPTLQLKNFVDSNILKSYENLIYGNQKWILCEGHIGKTNDFVMDSWLNRLYFERLELKANQIYKMLENTQNDWEAVLFHLLSKSFGMKLNGTAFLDLSQSFEFSLLRKVRSVKGLIENLLFGQAGFLEESKEDVFFNQLKDEYHFLKRKYNVEPISKSHFHFFRLRPSNFPTLRISQLAVLYECHDNLFSKIIECVTLNDYYELFSVETSDYWKSHYVFGKESKKRVKKTTKAFIDVLLLNAVIPLKYAYLRFLNKINFIELEKLLYEIKPEKNSIIEKFQKEGVKVESSFSSQALLQLKNVYCDHKRCIECTIGLQILKKNS